MIENHISSNLYNELFSESSEFSTVKTAQLFLKHFPPGLSHSILYFSFHKGKDTSAIPQPCVHHDVYVFPIFFHIVNALITSAQAKISLQTSFFTETCVSS